MPATRPNGVLRPVVSDASYKQFLSWPAYNGYRHPTFGGQANDTGLPNPAVAMMLRCRKI